MTGEISRASRVMLPSNMKIGIAENAQPFSISISAPIIVPKARQRTTNLQVSGYGNISELYSNSLP